MSIHICWLPVYSTLYYAIMIIIMISIEHFAKGIYNILYSIHTSIYTHIHWVIFVTYTIHVYIYMDKYNVSRLSSYGATRTENSSCNQQSPVYV